MDTRDLDRWARLVAASCSRRRTLQVVGAGALALGLGRRARFDALAADLGCCKCSGTLRCELDVATYGECKTLCGPRKQAIFAPNYTCTRGNSLNKVCKPKRRATDLALLAGAPGVYDLAFVDWAGAATIPGLFPVTTEALFTAAAAMAAGFVQENAAAVLFEEGVQVYHSLWRDAGETLGVFSHVSQHLTAEAATSWYDYALPQLGPEGAETFDFELSGTDAGTLIRFAFQPQDRPGTTITRLMAMTLTGEFVNWFGIDGHDTVPDPGLARAFAQAVVDALIDRPEQTESLAPYVALLPGAAACLPAFPAAAAKRAGATAARGQAQRGGGFQDPGAECEAPTGNIRYTFWNGAYVPRHGTPEDVIELNQDFFEGADRVLEQSYAVGNQIQTITIAHWWHPPVIENDGRLYFERRAEVDAARGAIRQELDGTDRGAGSWSAFAFPAGEQWINGVDRVIFAPPYSLSLGVLEPGEPPGDQEVWSVDGRIVTDMEALGSRPGVYDFDDFAEYTGSPASSPTFFDARYSAPPQADEVVSGGEEADSTLLRDFGAATAALERSPHMAGFYDEGESGTTYFAARSPYGGEFAWQVEGIAADVIEPLFDEQGLLQVRVEEYFTEGAAESLHLHQYQFPDRQSAVAGFDMLAGALAQPGREDLTVDPTVEIPGQSQSVTVRYTVETEQGQVVRHETVVQVGEIVVTATYDAASPQTDPTVRLTAVLADLIVACDDRAWAGEVGVAVQGVAPWMPIVKDQTFFFYNYDIVDGKPRAGVDAEQIAAQNPEVRTLLSGRYDLTGASLPIRLSFAALNFADQAAAGGYLEQLPALRQNDGSGVEWRLVDEPEIQPRLGLSNVVHAGKWTRAEDERLVGADVAVQAGTIVFNVSAFVPFTDGEAAFEAHDPRTGPVFRGLSNGIAELIQADYEQAIAGGTPGYIPGPRYDTPASWSRLGEEDLLADQPGLLDFAATAANLQRSPHLADYKGDGGATYLTAEAATRAQVFDEGVSQSLYGDYGLRQAHVYRYLSGGELDSLMFTVSQLEFPDKESADAAYDALRAALAQPGAQDITVKIPGQSESVTGRFNFETGERYVDRVETLIQHDEIVVTGTYDTSSTQPVPTEDPTDRVFDAAADLLAGYNRSNWAGVVNEGAQAVAPWGGQS